MPSARDFRGSRRALALVFRDGPKTASEASQALDKPTGSFYNLLKRMCAEGILVADTEGLGRGTRYELSPDAMRVLLAMDAPDPEPAPGAVAAGDLLLLVDDNPDDLEAVSRVLAEEWVGTNVRWSAAIADGWIMALDTADAFTLRRLRIELQRAGAKSRSLAVSEVSPGVALTALSGLLLDTIRQDS